MVEHQIPSVEHVLMIDLVVAEQENFLRDSSIPSLLIFFHFRGPCWAIANAQSDDGPKDPSGPAYPPRPQTRR